MSDERANERPYARAIGPLIEAMVQVAPDVLAASAARAEPG